MTLALGDDCHKEIGNGSAVDENPFKLASKGYKDAIPIHFSVKFAFVL